MGLEFLFKLPDELETSIPIFEGLFAIFRGLVAVTFLWATPPSTSLHPKPRGAAPFRHPKALKARLGSPNPQNPTRLWVFTGDPQKLHDLIPKSLDPKTLKPKTQPCTPEA